ncbi:MAG: D-alanyl-D-alanine carboxypeptidase/D-alanyl-D-alanine-endopeptidase [Algisphaera sp.]
MNRLQRRDFSSLGLSSLLNLLAPLALALALTAASSRAHAGAQANCDSAIQAANLGSTQVSVMVRDLTTGVSVVEINPDAPRVPASNMKLLTTAAALDRLGPHFRFRTRLEEVPTPTAENAADATEDTASDDLTGVSLRVIGDGDPAFGDPTLLAASGRDVRELIALWTQAVVDTGHTHYDQLLIDDRVLDHEWTHPDWPKNQFHLYYCAQVSGLNFHENVMSVLPTPGAQKGATPSIAVYPKFPQLQTSNRAKTGDSDVFGIRRRPGTNKFSFNGSVRRKPSAPYRVTVHDPPMFFGQYLQYELSRVGVKVDHVARVANDYHPGKPVQPLHTLQTTLAGVIDRTNQDSQNMFAEALFKRMGHHLTGEPGSFTDGAAAVRLFLRDRISKRTGLAGVAVADGSGMSRHNRVTARVFVELLTELHADPTLGPLFAASLARGGESGTLRRHRDALRDLNAKVYAKSGYLGASANYASTLTGYLVAPNGRAYAFSFLFNGFHPPLSNLKIKRLQNDLLAKLDDALTASMPQVKTAQ